MGVPRGVRRVALVGLTRSAGGVAVGLYDGEASFSYALGSAAVTVFYRFEYGLLDELSG